MRIYIAGPLFSQGEKEFNKKLKELVAPFAEIYLPQENGLLLTNLVRSTKDLIDAANTVVKNDIEAIEACDVFIIVLDGRAVEEGSAFELGMAFVKGKICIGLQTDPRREILGINNPMIEHACSRIYDNLEDLVSFVRNELLTADLEK